MKKKNTDIRLMKNNLEISPFLLLNVKKNNNWCKKKKPINGTLKILAQ